MDGLSEGGDDGGILFKHDRSARLGKYEQRNRSCNGKTSQEGFCQSPNERRPTRHIEGGHIGEANSSVYAICDGRKLKSWEPCSHGIDAIDIDNQKDRAENTGRAVEIQIEIELL